MTDADSYSTPRVALFQERELRRTFWEDQWWFEVEDVVLALIESRDPKQYIQRMKQRDPELAKGRVQIVRTLPIATSGGTQNLNCANTEGLFRLIQSIPSPMAEPFKRWLAKVGKERLDEIENPELAMGRMQDLYEKKGYPKEWIDKRLHGMAVRQDLTDEWKQRGVTMSHAVARLREARMARLNKPFIARGSRAPRCPGCRVMFSHCLCALRPQVPTRAGMCLIMCDIEPLKPSNTGWLIADVVQDTFAFGWARTEVDPALLALLADPQWTPYLVFPGEFVEAERVVTEVPQVPGKRPLFVLLDATWPEARKMFRKSPYLNHLPVLSLLPEQLSRYRLRRSTRDDHLCTSEVASLCLALAGEPRAADTLETYLAVFTHHYLNAKQSVPPDLEDAAHQRLRSLACLDI